MGQPLQIRSVHFVQPTVPHAVQAAGVADQFVATAALLKLLADSWNDWLAFSKTERGALQAFMFFGNLAPDLVNVATLARHLPAELSSLTQDGVDALLGTLQEELDVPSDKGQDILASALKLANDAYSLVTDIKGIILASKS